MSHGLRNGFGRTRWYSYVMRLKWKLISVSLEILLILTQDRCMVCVEHTIGSEIILDAPNGAPGDEAQVEDCFGTFGDSANLDAR